MIGNRRGRPVPADIAARGTPDPKVERKRQRVDGPRAQVVAFADPFLTPIPQAQEFVLQSGAVATAAVETLSPAGLTLQLLQNEVARISSVTVYITGLLASTQVNYRLTIGGAPLWPSVAFFPRAATSAGDNYETFIRVRNAGLIAMLIDNVDGGTYTVGAIITGWKFNQQDADRFLYGG